MEYIHAALLLHQAKKEITEDAMKKVIESTGVSPDDAKIKSLIASLDGVDIKEVLEEAKSRPAAPAANGSADSSDKSEEKKEEKKEEPKAEAAEGLGALFG